MFRNLVSRRALSVLGASAIALAATQANAITVGAGTGIPLEAVDTAGGVRLNVDQSFTQVLQPGIYVASEWEFAAGQAGETTPFLSVDTGGDTYSVVAVGATATVAGAGINTASFGTRSNTFVITAPTTIFGGITSPTTQNPVFLDNGTATLTDHDSSPSVVTNPGNAVNGISNPNLGRTYAFAITADTRQSEFRLGADVAIPRDALDNADGPRLNIDKSFTLTLGPGFYQVDDFSYAAGRVGDVIPFLAVLNGDRYEIVAQGDTVTTGAGLTINTVEFGGSRYFTLNETTTLFAGITNPSGSNPIFTDLASGFFTDHDGSPAAVNGVGTELLLSGISNLNLDRSYAFSLGVSNQIIPEPATATLALFGLGGLLLRRRRVE